MPSPFRLLLRLAVLPGLCFMVSIGTAGAAERLEVQDTVPALVDYEPGSADRPLVVFIPGAGHLARIAYGAPQARPQDFLAWWLHRETYGFLAVSYPLGGTMMAPAAPQFTVADWGRQAARITQDIMTAHHLGGHVILVGWSMGGRILESYVTAAAARGLKVDLYVSLASTPDTERHAPPPNLRPSADGYAHLDGISTVFGRQLALEDRINGHVIISADAYTRDYIGDTPVALAGWGLRYSPGAFVVAAQDKPEVVAYDKLPIVAAIHGNSPEDPLHALADQVVWGGVLTNVLLAKSRALGAPTHLSALRWSFLESLFANAPAAMSASVEGNHFFFVGERGARRTARMIDVMARRARAMEKDLVSRE